MSKNPINVKKKENQEMLSYILVFALIFIVLFLVNPPTLDFSVEEPEFRDERQEHVEIKRVLEDMDFDNFQEYEPIPEYEDEIGRENPFKAIEGLTPEEIEEILPEEDLEEVMDTQPMGAN